MIWRRPGSPWLRASPVDLAEATLVEGLARLDVTPDVAFDASGRSEARRGLVDVLGQRGVLVCVGHGQGLELKVSPDLIATERAVMGSEYFPHSDLARNHALLVAHGDAITPLVTHRFGLPDVVEAFELFLAGEKGKVVIAP